MMGMNDQKCPNCNDELQGLGGASAHPDNSYCDSCWREKWEANTAPVKGGLVFTYAQMESAIERLEDMLIGDDAQAWKEAQRFVDKFRSNSRIDINKDN